MAIVPLDDPPRALAEIDRATALGLGAVWISADAPGGRSPGHPAHDRIWATLAERGLPFILHVGSAPLSIPAPWMNDGVPDRVTARGGAEVIGSKDLTVIHHAAQRFISTLVLDGVLERFPGLRGGVIEIGAGWAPDMIRRLDHAASIWAKSEPHLALMTRPPSQQIREQLRFTPTRSRTWRKSSASRIPSFTCSRRTIPTPRAAATRSADLNARPKLSTMRREAGSSPATFSISTPRRRRSPARRTEGDPRCPTMRC